MRADEADRYDRIRNPETGRIVEVQRTMVGLAVCRVFFRCDGFFGSFTVQPRTELEECA